ncbi:sugar ABC transporter ATP-binding protein [Vineibacter terrae]|uniref:Sugar ABC transporter ATP-binding protein n=1 Tax=Vineibacter terrae TaxID=2586908 RepID=A0A5C8PMQ5_9HYPH|nr:sugar ABC transporter ATP-binding protein [Vineibacter terrae]TXL75192.1 sugar ABC transporter ATP-binding protein [Vineibacter terrae]
MADAPPPILSLVGVSKAFGGVQALQDVDFTLRAGEVHGLVGENGAGKSTMMKIIAGVHADYAGRFLLDGREVRFRSTRDAHAAGIAMVHQELSIAPDLSVAENVFLGTQITNRLGMVQWRRMAQEAESLLARLGVHADPRQQMGDLPIGMQQLVEIARVLFSGARIIILDEPTSALSPPEIARLFSALRHLRAAGRSIVFISHFIDDILSIADTVTVFRNGRKIMTVPAADTTKGGLIQSMIGRGHAELEESYTNDIRLAAPAAGPVVLEADGLCLGRSLRDVSLSVRAGEVVGIYGFMGCGQAELARVLFGKMTPERGSIRVAGRRLRRGGTAGARRAGVAFVPDSRRAMLFHQEPVYKNTSISILGRLSRLFLKPAQERALAQRQIEALRIRPPRVDALLGALSGGNQQKVALAKWLTYPPKVLVLSEPTRGMDVGAKDEVVKIVHGLKAQGLAVVIVSSEPETVLSMADRILVLRKGELVREFADEIVSKDRLLEAA